MWMDEPFGMFSVMNTLFPILFFGVFAVVILTFVVALVRGAGQWRRNNAAPVLTVEAEVVAKRTQVSRGARAHGDMTDMTGGFTHYYATFEVESGSRIELALGKHLPRGAGHAVEHGILPMIEPHFPA